MKLKMELHSFMEKHALWEPSVNRAEQTLTEYTLKVSLATLQK